MNKYKSKKVSKKSVYESSSSSKSLPLVAKLNLHTIMYAVGVLFTVNIIIIIGIVFYAIGDIEADAAKVLKELPKERTEMLGYSFSYGAKSHDGIFLIEDFNNLTPSKNHDVSRKFWFDSKEKKSISSIMYKITYLDLKLCAEYKLGEKLESYVPFIYLILAIQLFVILTGIGKNSKRIRKIMRPITDMTKEAQSLSSSASRDLSPEEIARIRELAGTISNIDATKLDKRLSFDSQQTELQNLAAAINSMLNRIDEAYKAQARFVSDASHELRTPISVIQGYVNLLDRWGKNDEAALLESIDAIKSEADSMKDLIEQLLFLARGDNETMKLNVENFNCCEIIDEIFKEAQMIDPNHLFRIKNCDPVYISADRQLMKQAIRILLDNSIKYTPIGGEITIGVTEEFNMAKISVQDTGIGIDPENIPYIFDRFYRSDESRARKTGGSGLGLAIMKWIIDRHNGSVEVISRKDIGTRTTIILPCAVPTEKIVLES